jgi:RimJ/RimL family protein N-acetyltransferase
MSEAGRHLLDNSQRSQVLLSDGRTAELRVMQRWDRHDVLSLFRRLPNRVRPMLPDTNDEAAIDRWISDLETGQLTAVIARATGRAVAYAGIRRRDLPWTAHAGDLVLVVAEEWSPVELAGHLWRELMGVPQLAEMRKLEARVPHDAEPERAILRQLGFRVEGVLTDHIVDEAGRTHDLIVAGRPMERSFVVTSPPRDVVQETARVAAATSNAARTRARCPKPYAVATAHGTAHVCALLPEYWGQRYGIVLANGLAIDVNVYAGATLAESDSAFVSAYNLATVP